MSVSVRRTRATLPPGSLSRGWVVGVHVLADGAGDAILAGVYAIEGAMTVAQLACSWNPWLTIGEAIRLAAQSFTRDPGTLSCCAT